MEECQTIFLISLYWKRTRNCSSTGELLNQTTIILAITVIKNSKEFNMKTPDYNYGLCVQLIPAS